MTIQSHSSPAAISSVDASRNTLGEVGRVPVSRRDGLVALSGHITVANASEILVSLRDAVSSGADVVVDISELLHADISLVQLIISTSRTAAASGIGFRIEGDLAPVERAAAGALDLASVLGKSD